jgi:hypothetical protein
VDYRHSEEEIFFTVVRNQNPNSGPCSRKSKTTLTEISLKPVKDMHRYTDGWMDGWMDE